MQVSKFLLTVCTTAVCAGFISVHAQDNPAQAAARAALMNSMNSQSTSTEQPTNAPILIDSSGVVPQKPSPPAPTTQIATPAPAPVAAAPVAAAPVVQAPVAAPQPLDAEAQARARAALLQTMGLPPTETPAATPAPTATVMPAPNAVTPTPATPMPPEVKPVAAMPANASIPQFANEPGYTPIVAPPLPISMTKEQQLETLLAQYKADQISPEQYHKQRAAILAEP
jgi:hypothetical protein